MLKKCYRLFLGLLVVTGSACVTPTHASSASIVITNIRAGSQASAAEEGVALYNNSSFEANVTNWCLTNKAVVKFACFAPASEYEAAIIPAYSYATVVSTMSVNGDNQGNYSLIYDPNSGSSGSIVASADTVSLIDETGQIVDQFAWSSSVSSTQQWARTKLSLLPDLFIDTDASIDWQKVAFSGLPLGQLHYREIPHDAPVDDPTGQPDDDDNPTTQPEELVPPIITELLPNAVGTDTGNEFIEIYNPNKQANISLNGYKIAVGPLLDKTVVLSEYILKPGEYKVFTNAELPYSLLNSSSRVSLFLLNGDIASEAPAYDSPKEGESWALVDGLWQYTNQPTPGEANVNSVLKAEDETESSASSAPKACAANQYRSPDTNRCRLIATAASTTPTPCKEGQQRNLETGRCRNIVSATTTTCKEGQEKNPETNRCRNIKQLATADYGVKGATVKQQGGTSWYVWAAIAGVVALVIGYGVWEWREELKKLLQAVKAKFAGRPN